MPKAGEVLGLCHSARATRPTNAPFGPLRSGWCGWALWHVFAAEQLMEFVVLGNT